MKPSLADAPDGFKESLLTRECGLKPLKVDLSSATSIVAPYAGVWIETPVHRHIDKQYPVAPYAGAWIETFRNYTHYYSNFVAPYAGAWIETLEIGKTSTFKMSLLTRERGLKQAPPCCIDYSYSVAPYAGAWIETSNKTFGTWQ